MNKEEILNDILIEYMMKINQLVDKFYHAQEDDPQLYQILDSIMATFSVGWHLKDLILDTQDEGRIYDWSCICYIYQKQLSIMMEDKVDISEEMEKSYQVAIDALKEADHALEALKTKEAHA